VSGKDPPPFEEGPERTINIPDSLPSSMCDMAEEEFAEYLLWLEAEQVRPSIGTSTTRPRVREPAPRIEPPPPVPAAA